jgi:SHS2 domain-containing protein
MPYKVLDHTADFGLVVTAPQKDSLFEEVALALFTEIVENLNDVSTVEEISFTLTGEDDVDLMINWLSELLFYFDARKMLFSKFKVNIEKNTLEGHAYGEKFNPEKHRLRLGVKSATYHGAKIERVEDGWRAQVIFDV